MKPRHLAALLLVCCALAGDTGQGPTFNLAWDDNSQPPHDPANTFILYHATNANGPYAPYLLIPGTETTCTMPLLPGAHFFYMTISNPATGELGKPGQTIVW